MDISDMLLLLLWKRLKEWRHPNQTLQQRIIGKQHLLKLFALWSLTMHEEKRARKRVWVRPIFREGRRLLQGASNNLVREMEVTDQELFYNYCRMSAEMFEQLLGIVGPFIEKQQVVRDPIPARTRLLACLRYLASGDSMSSIDYSFRIGGNTVSKIVSETCMELWNTLHNSVMPAIEEDDWVKIADGFASRWDFPHCIGAIDGKHVVLQAPPNSGSTFYNYKGTHSINLLAVCDSNYCFTLVDIGAEGRQSDSGIFANSVFGQRFESNEMRLPPPCPIEPSGPAMPFVLVADEAFALTHYMMRPYPRSGYLNRQRKVFNYRLSRARRMIESAFGILAAKWRIYRRPIIASLPTAEKIVQATVCLHNFVIQNEDQLSRHQRRYTQRVPSGGSEEGGALREINDAIRINGQARFVSTIRNNFAAYFENAGAVPWQWEKVMNNEF